MSSEVITEQTKPAAASDAPLEFLAFRLGGEEYGIDIHKVQELRGYDAVTQIANSPAFIKGVINLRGAIVPIVDMRIKFALGTPVYDMFTVVVILSIASRMVGIVVDSVSDVITLDPAQLKAVPQTGSSLDAGHLLGMGTVQDRMLILLDIEKLMSGPDLGRVTTVVA
jgi:purine-binding chemotaxis protein CheW